MDFDIILTRVLTIIAHFLMITVAYLFSKYSLRTKYAPPKFLRLLKLLILWFLTIVAISYFISTKGGNTDNTDINTFVTYFIVLYIPCVVGLIDANQRDKKMNLTERINKIRKDEENLKEARHDEF